MTILAMETWQWILIGVLGVLFVGLLVARASQGKKKDG